MISNDSGETFGQMIARLRGERGFSQNHLARMSGIDPAYVNRMERDGPAMAPRKAVMLSVSEALDLSYAERDRLLWLAGLAPEVDWQARCEDLEAALETVKGAVAVLEMVRAAVVDLESIEEPPFIRRRTAI